MVGSNMDNDYSCGSEYLEMVDKGERIVRVIAIIYIVIQILGFFLTLNFIGLLISIAIAVGLMMGKNWVRILYAIFSIVGIFFVVASCVRVAEVTTVPIWFLLMTIIVVGINVAFVILLTMNSSVNAFFEHNKCRCNK